ncbi:hypothetical protein WR25_12328 [Diploscapter pachys]|uniref:Uncharacterized protein n=1 Tax=Diploscapter pachys TaxID=2018661 RepID=A0A2A2KWY2_9BILA|nr:hypothetical protein WR25_12328 [Diploscapter pachys]
MKFIIVFISLFSSCYAITCKFGGTIYANGQTFDNVTTVDCTTDYYNQYCVSFYTNSTYDYYIDPGTWFEIYGCDDKDPSQKLCTSNECRSYSFPLNTKPYKVTGQLCCNPAALIGKFANFVIPVAAYLIYQILQK